MIDFILKTPLWILAGCLTVIFISNAVSADSVHFELWEINSLKSIGGHSVTVKGNPEVVKTKHGDAVKFDGAGDMLVIDKNPLSNAKAFTVEVVFKPDAGVNIKNQPRFIHMGAVRGARLMIELRVNNQNEWYLDGFLKTDKDDLVLIDGKKTHPTGDWMHAAVAYANSTMKTYVNGKEELSGQVEFSEYIVETSGKTSIGARQNEQNWYSGLIRNIKITHAGLDPGKFIFINKGVTAVERFPNPNSALLGEIVKMHPNLPNELIHFVEKNVDNPVRAEVYVYNIFGKAVLHAEPAFTHITNACGFQTGLYLVFIKTPNHSISRKLFIGR